MTKIKICGLAQPADAVAAARAGADFLGMVFAPSRRQLTIEQAQAITGAVAALEPRPALVGVFVNQELAEVERIAGECRLDWVQLSGDESWAYCLELNRPIIRVVHATPERKTSEVLAELETGFRLLLNRQLICMLDSRSGDLFGGTGQVFDWVLASEVSAFFPVFVAGGLTPENIGRLVRQVRPWGVDVSSGVETEGRKDIDKILEFIKTVRQAEAAESAPATGGEIAAT